MRQVSKEDAHISEEVCTEFEKLITAPEKSDFRCHLCQSLIEYGPLPTTDLMMAYRCNCRIGSKWSSSHRKRVCGEIRETHSRWEQIINAV
jgi:hypothetical protein